MSAIERKKRVRAVQQRAEETREALLAAAIELFSSRGYDGTSIREVESLAGIKRGLAAYHFGTKADLWKAAVGQLFDSMAKVGLAEVGEGSEAKERLRGGIRAFVRFGAAHPELNRLMVQEGKIGGWRSEYLVEHFVRPRVDALTTLVGRPLDPHELYTLIGASTFVFNVEHECEALFGVNPRNESFADAHAELVASLLLGETRGLLDPS